MDPWYIRFNVGIAALLALIIWLLSYFVFHVPQGTARLVWVLAGVAVAVLYLVLFRPRKPW